MIAERPNETVEVNPAPPPRRGRPGLLAFVVLAVLTAVGVLPRLWRTSELAAAAREASRELPAVNVVRPRAAPDSGLSLPASIEAVTQTTVNARTTGYVKQRFVDIGDRVHQGQPLAEIESPDVDEQERQAQAEAVKAQAVSGQASADVARQSAAVGQAEAQVATAEARAAQSRAARATAAARVVQAEQTLRARRADDVRARSQLALARKTWQRYDELVKQGFVTLQEADTMRTSFETARASADAARMAVAGAAADVEAARTTLQAADADVNAAQATVSAARQQVSAAQASLLASRQTLDAARAGQASSVANARRYGVLRGFEMVDAPFDGVITSRNVDNGTLVKADNVGVGSNTAGLFGLAKIDVLRVNVRVPQTMMRFLRVHDAAELLVREFPGRQFKGEIFRIAGGLDPASRTILTEVRVKNPDRVLLPGMYTQVRLTSDAVARPLRIPASALVVGAEGTRVATVTAERKVHFVKIEIDRDLGSELEIASGLQPDTQVVVNPTEDLREGGAVEVAAPRTEASGAPSGAPGAK